MNRHYPEVPIVGVGAVVLAGDLVLLVKRGVEPAKGLWSIPGGAVELGESLEEACAREVAEETGIAAEVGPLVEVVQRILRDGQGRVEYHYVLADYLCLAEPAEPKAADDAADARWVPLHEMEAMGLTADTAWVIRRAVAMNRPPSS